MSNLLIIPGDDGDELYDVTAAANHLGMAVSTLRSHQYQDRKRQADDAGPEVPKPEDPDSVVIQLPGGAGVEWARIIEELMLRAGGAGKPVRLWSLRKLDAYLAVTRDPEVRLARAMFGKDSSIMREVEEGAARAFEETGNPRELDAILHGETWQEATTNPDGMVELGPSLRPIEVPLTVTDPEAAQALKADIKPGDIEVQPKLTAREVLEQARLRREAR